MIDRVIELSIRYRWSVICAALLVALVGGWCMVRTPLDAIPDLSETQVIVFSQWSGHPPDEVDDQVTRPVASQLQGLPGVRVVRTSSDYGYSMIHVIFEEHVKIAEARAIVSEQLDAQQAALPPGVVPALAPEAPATGQIFWYVVEGRGFDLGELRDIQDSYVRQQLATVSGVAEVASVGGFPVEYRIAVDPERLRAHEVELQSVLDELAELNAPVGGNVLQTPTAELLIRVSTTPGDSTENQRTSAIRSLENLVVPSLNGGAVRLDQIAKVSVGPGPRRGILEQEGREVVGGVVLMRYGNNPLEVIRRLREKIISIQPSLPSGVRIVASYDRSPLIHAAIGTLSRGLIEAIVTASLCVFLIMRHFRTSLVVSLSLPLSILASFMAMTVLRESGMMDIDTNIMSLAGLVISIGVLVDSSIVMAENVMHTLHVRFGNQPVTGDTRDLIVPACQTVGRPIFFSVMIMLLSFLPVFALGGLEGKMFRPLALTKSFALGAAAIIAITLVPALCSLMVRGKLRGERESWFVRSLIDAYRPMLSFLLDRPAAITWIIAVTFLIGFAPLGRQPVWAAELLTPWTALGQRPALLAALVVSLAVSWLVARRWWTRIAMVLSLTCIAVLAERAIQPLSSEFLAPLDEQTVMDMPITIPRASTSQAADDLIARDMILCRFPEVDMVMGKAGRAETATDPAPIDMIETMVGFRPRQWWPRRKLARDQAAESLAAVQQLLEKTGAVSAQDLASVDAEKTVDAILFRFDRLMREYAYQRNQEHLRSLSRALSVSAVRAYSRELVSKGQLAEPLDAGQIAGIAAGLDPDATRQLALNPVRERIDELLRGIRSELRRRDLSVEAASENSRSVLDLIRASDPLSRVEASVRGDYDRLWKTHIRDVNRDLVERGAGTLARLVLEELLVSLPIREAKLANEIQRLRAFRLRKPKTSAAVSHHGVPSTEPLDFDPLPSLDRLQEAATSQLARGFALDRANRSELVEFGGEMDQCLQMPGWTNVWTRPIQNRVDMLATGVNTTVGIRVLGRDLDRVVSASEKIAEIIRQVEGAANVIADPIRGKGYLSVELDARRAAEAGVALSDANRLLAVALGGVTQGAIQDGHERHAIRVVLPPDSRNDVAAIRRLLVPARRTPPAQGGISLSPAVGAGNGSRATVAPERGQAVQWVELGSIADVEITEGPASIKGENGLLRNYVRLNVLDRDPIEFVDEAQRIVAEKAELPQGVYLEWTGQFEHQLRARQRLFVLLPIVLVCIFAVLYFTYRDAADALLMLTAVPGAIAGGLIAQWICGYKFSVTVWVGYIACLGMATSTGIIMLVYLRQAVDQAGGLANISLPELRETVLRGAVHRLRPKLLTEATTIISLAPMLWATGVGSEVIRPMIAPVLGGILVADEVIDLLLPVAFYWLRRRRWEKLHPPGSDVG